jgi:uncharacterized protein YndB with AHSA1/START domain
MDPTTITRQIDLDTPADVLWDLVSDPDEMANWLGDRVDVDVRNGGEGTVVDDGIVRHVVIEEVLEARELSFTWWEPEDRSRASRVVFTVDPHGSGSRLTISETLHHQSPRLSARASAVFTASARWEVRALALWACTVAAVSVR